MRGNYVMMFRDIPDWLKKSPNTFHLLAEFARRARREEGKVVWNGEIINLKPGEFITGRKSTSKELGLTESQYRAAYRICIESVLIRTIRTTRRYTISLYCSNSIIDINLPTESPTEQPSEKPSEHLQPATNNNDKKEKKTIKKEEHPLSLEESPSKVQAGLPADLRKKLFDSYSLPRRQDG